MDYVITRRTRLQPPLTSEDATFVHRVLWPAVYRLVTDAEWRAAQQIGLTPAARRLLDQVEAAGELRLDQPSVRAAACGHGDRRAVSGARDDLEHRMLVHSQQIHTERGNHVTVLSTWQTWAARAAPDLASEAREMDRAAAEAALRSASGEAPLATEPRPARRATRRRAP